MIRDRALHPDVMEKAREVLQALADGKLETWMVAHARDVLPAFKGRQRVEKAPIASVAHHDQARREEDSAEDRQEQKVYRQVARRDRVCQVTDLATFGPHGGRLTIDHQWGRGKEPTRLESCRRICELHHRKKTDSAPSRLAWVLDFLQWATAKRYWAEVEKATAAVELERGQHPEAARG